MARSACAIIVLFASVLSASPAAFAEARIALLIGNENYAPSVGPLSNPHNDVARLGAALQKIGFEVTTVNNAGFAQLNGAVSAYARKLSAGGQRAIGFFYYSGHGAQNKENGVNYLIPTDVKSVDAELWDYSVPLKSVTDTMRERAPNATHFVVFDACRNSLKLKEPGSKALMQSKGFEPVRAVSGMLVAYATAEGETASDLGSGAGPYSTALADEIVKPGIEAVAMFRKVQLRVHASIGQEPWLSYGTIGEIWFAGREERAAAPAPSAQSMAPARLSEAAEAWGATKDATSIPMLELFIASYKDTYYAGLARLRIEELKRQRVAVAAPTKVPAPPTQADLPKLAAPVSPSDPKTVPRAVQLELARLGCFAGTPSGDWGPKTREALRRFNKRAPKAVAVTGDPAEVDISVLRAVNAPLCPTQDCSTEEVEQSGRCIAKLPGRASRHREMPPLLGLGVGCTQIERMSDWIVDAQVRIGTLEGAAKGRVSEEQRIEQPQRLRWFLADLTVAAIELSDCKLVGKGKKQLDEVAEQLVDMGVVMGTMGGL